MSISNYNNWCKVKGKKKRIFNCACRPLLPFWVHMDPCIEQVSSAKSLGVYIDQTLLNWECHINSVCKNIASAIGAIKRMGHLSYVMFWSSFIIALSNLTLIIVLWCGETVTRALISEKLQRLQNRAASILLVLPQLSTHFLKSRFSYSGAQLCNNLPTKIRSSNLLKDFKVKKVATVLSKVSVKFSVWLFRHGFMKSSFYFFLIFCIYFICS